MVIHDRSYSRWDGDKTRPVRAAMTIFESGLRRGVALLFKRKIPAILMTLAAFGPFVFFLGAIYVRYYVLAKAETFNPDIVEVFQSSEFQAMTSANAENVFNYMFNMQWPFVFVACVMIGAGLIAEDRRANALELYLSRPVGIVQYLLGKLLTIGFFIALVTVIPAIVLLLAQMSLSWGEPGELGRLLALLVRTVLAGAVWVGIPALLILAASALTQRARNAAIAWLAVVVLLQFVISEILLEVFAQDGFRLLQIGFNCRQVGAWILGDTVNLVDAVPLWQSGAVLAGWVALCVSIMLRKVKPVEIVA
jgi:ABC-type transport system involved in multi-copper enzyme maturation permease subunit